MGGEHRARHRGASAEPGESTTGRAASGAAQPSCPDTDTRGDLVQYLSTLRLVDQHCHSVVPEPLERAGFESLLTEADGPGEHGTTLFDTQTGLAVRRYCAPVLGLPAHADPQTYLAARTALGPTRVTAALMRAAGVGELCVDDGPADRVLLTGPELAAASGARVHRVVRLEQVAEQVLAAGCRAGDFPESFRAELRARAAGAVAVTSVAGYRTGLALPGQRPREGEVRTAAARALSAADRAGRTRVSDPVLHAFAVWCGVDLCLPVQFHTGFGARDLDLSRCDPTLLTPLLRALTPTGVPVVLLHTYPFHRQAGYLARVFPHVFTDLGLAVVGVGRRAGAVLAEALELAPFGKFLYSSDGYGLPELHHLGAVLFRRALASLLAEGVGDGSWTVADALRLGELVCTDNARRVYRW